MNRTAQRAFAASLALTLSLSGPMPAIAQGSRVTISEEAKQHFKAGVDFLKDPDGARYEEAYREFRAAYKASPSWKILGNLGLCLMKLERNSEAIETYERYLKEGGKEIEKGEREQVEADLKLLKVSSAQATITVKGVTGDVKLVDERMRANGTAVVNEYAATAGSATKLLLVSGRHVITAKAQGREARWEVELTSEKPQETTLDLTAKAAPTPPPAASSATEAKAAPPPAPESKGMSTLRLAGIGTAAVGGAMVIGGVITGLIGKGKLSDLDAACVNKHCPPDRKGDADTIKTLQTTTNVLLIGGAVVAVAGVTLIVVGGSSSGEAAKAPGPSVAVSLTGTGLSASGSF